MINVHSIIARNRLINYTKLLYYYQFRFLSHNTYISVSVYSAFWTTFFSLGQTLDSLLCVRWWCMLSVLRFKNSQRNLCLTFSASLTTWYNPLHWGPRLLLEILSGISKSPRQVNVNGLSNTVHLEWRGRKYRIFNTIWSI